jgi:tripartite-type tricarboxylate transporter receptor subunit TctC
MIEMTAAGRSRRLFAAALALALGSTAASPALAQAAWPKARHITVVMPYPPGGPSDGLARIYIEKLGARLGTPVVVDYRPGANTLVASKHVMGQPADGYTFYITSNAMHQGPLFFPKQFNYEPFDTVTPIGMMSMNPLVLVVNGKLPAKNVRELIALAKSRSEPLSFATSGVGSPDHLSGELLAHRAGIRFNFIPYKGGAPATQDVVAGQVQVRIDTITNSKPFFESGRLRALGVMNGPTPLLPGVPGVPDTVPGVRGEGFFYLVAPKGLPAPIAERMARETREILSLPDVQQRVRALGLDPMTTASSRELVDFLRQDYEVWKEVLRVTGLKLEQ